MSYRFYIPLLLVLFCPLMSCDTVSKGTPTSTLAQRVIQTRTFSDQTKKQVLDAVVTTLQDRNFIVDKADATLGIITATKLDGSRMRASVSIKTSGLKNKDVTVRINAFYGSVAIDDGQEYQLFFAALARNLFGESDKG